MIIKILGLLTGSFAQYAAIAAALVGIYSYHNYSIKSAAVTEATLKITTKALQVQNERIKKARSAGDSVNSKRLYKGREPYQRD